VHGGQQNTNHCKLRTVFFSTWIFSTFHSFYLFMPDINVIGNYICIILRKHGLMTVNFLRCVTGFQTKT